MGELDEVAGDVHHAVVFIHHHHAAGAHDGADLGQGLVVHRGVEHLLRDAAARGAAGLDGLDGAAVDAAFADVVDEGLEGGAEGHLDEAGARTLPTSEKTLVPALLALPVSVNQAGPLLTMGGDVVPGLDVVDIGGLAVQALLGRERRTGTGTSGVAFERGDEGRLLAADEGARALDQVDVEAEVAAEDLFAEQAVLARLFDGAGETVDGERILGADVDDALGGAGDVAADDHAFDERVGIAFDLIAVHVGAGVALVGVADDVLLVRLGLGEELPLVAGEVAGAAAAAELGGLDLLDDDVGALIDQDLIEGLVAADADVLLDVVGVDEAAVAEDDLLLALEEGDVVPVRAARDSPGRT